MSNKEREKDKHTILIADDAEMNRTLLRAILEDKYNIVEAADGEEALAILRDKNASVSVVVTDLVMPGIDGYDMISIMDSEGFLDDIPVVVLTAMNDAESELRALELGASDVITKPFDGRKVLRRIENIVARIEIESIKSNYRILKAKQDEADRYRLLRELSSTITCDYNVLTNEHFVSENISAHFPGDYRTNSNIFSLFVKYGVLHPKHSERLQKHTAQVFSSKAPDADGVVRAAITLPLFTVRGTWEYFTIKTVLIKDEKGRDIRIITLIDNVDSDVKAQLELRRRAEFDDLTGIFNKRTFLSATLDEINSNPDTTYLLVRFDIERFKVVNDLFGTENGDLVLRKIAQKLDEIFLGVGVFGRISADRFACCFPEGALDIPQLHSDMFSSLQTLIPDFPIVLKMGIYRITDRTPHIEQMCDRAQLALQTVKGNYSQNWAYYDDKMRSALIQEQEILRDMDTALEQNQFVVYFQPIFSAATGKPRSAEALVRWVHPEKGMLSPAIFIPIFEHNGFITKLDLYVWEKVCCFLSECMSRHEKVIPISVNISRLNFYSDSLCDRLIETVEKYNVPPSLIRIEITESAYTDNPKQLLDAMKRLQEYGFNILMDDFGSGYSSLNMLKDIPIDILKIDMKFLNDLQSNVRAGSVMNNVVRMAKWLEMNVVAEGVETREQVDFLRSIGCDMLQGYYFSRPIPQDEYLKLIDTFELDPMAARSINDFELDVLWEVCKESSLLRNRMVGAIGIYELQGDTLEIIRVNDGYYELTGSDPTTFLHRTKTATAWIHELDRPRLLAACRSAKETDDVQELVVRRYHQDGHLLHLRLKIRYAGCHGTNDLLYFSFDEVTREEELAERNSDGRFSAVCAMYDAIIELDYA
ncbi:MAG: EAL domain-containing protein, partial [Oscillospiraceae bacterium]|nr:EAL domain-containing protein [Oscillospiraceae bacterium]